jgi:excisionase family DNA binding protein
VTERAEHPVTSDHHDGEAPRDDGAMRRTGQRLTISVEEVGRLLGISRGLAYVLVNRGDIPSIRLGRRIVVPRKALDRLLDLPHDAS